MNKIKVTKMQGLGNDFAIIDYSEYEKSRMSMSELAIKICDRHKGIGADGMIIPRILDDAKDADISWFFYNSDGSVAQMCGNGIRCFAKYVKDKHLVNKNQIRVRTLAGIIVPEIQSNGTVRVNMSKPILEPKKIPFNGENFLNNKVKVLDKNFTFNAISMGNPHCVIFVNRSENLLELAQTYGKELEKNTTLFPEKTKVEFAHVKSRQEIDMRVYERGCGITLACGTGACATAVSAILNNLTDGKVQVNLLGGALTIDWQGNSGNQNSDIFMTGPAEYTFLAEYIL